MLSVTGSIQSNEGNGLSDQTSQTETAEGAAAGFNRRSDQPVKGALLMIAGSVLITFNDASTKIVVTDHSVSQAIFIRGIFTLLPVLFLVYRAGGWQAARWNNIWSQLLCAVPLVGSLFLFIYSLSYIPIAIATIIFYVSPLFVTALAPVLGERVGWRRWGAVLLGFAGAVLVIEPTGASFSWGMMIPVIAAFTLALRDLATRRIVDGESSLSILVVSSVAIIIAALPPAVIAWTPMSVGDLALLAFSGLAFGFSLYLLTEAFRFADASLVSPIKYSGVLMAAVLGYVIWGDVPSLSALIGAALIVASLLVILRREHALGLDDA